MLIYQIPKAIPNRYLISLLVGVWTKYMEATPNITAILLSSPNLTYSESCFAHVQPKPDSLRILRGPRDPDIPWPGFLLGQTPASIWYLSGLTTSDLYLLMFEDHLDKSIDAHLSYLVDFQSHCLGV